MELLVHLPEVLPIHMRIDLRRRDVRMPEHLLDGSEVSATFEQVRGE